MCCYVLCYDLTSRLCIVCVCFAELEVARLSTDGNLADLTFPQSEQHGNSIQLSASTLRQHGRNGTREISHSLLLLLSHFKGPCTYRLTHFAALTVF